MKKLNSSGFSPFEAVILLAVVMVIGFAFFNLYKSKVVHAGSWTALSLEPTNNIVDLSGISGQACNLSAPNGNMLQVEVTDTNPDLTEVIYETYASIGGQSPSSYMAKKTYTTGINQDVYISVAASSYLSVKITVPGQNGVSGFFYNPAINPNSQDSKNVIPGSLNSGYINPSQLTTCPGSNAASLSTPNIKKTLKSASAGYLKTIISYLKELI
jgi:hypothetical protein